MKLKGPDSVSSASVDGETFVADESGHIELPYNEDKKAQLIAMGFTPVEGEEAPVAAAEPAPAPAPEPAPAPAPDENKADDQAKAEGDAEHA